MLTLACMLASSFQVAACFTAYRPHDNSHEPGMVVLHCMLGWRLVASATATDLRNRRHERTFPLEPQKTSSRPRTPQLQWRPGSGANAGRVVCVSCRSRCSSTG